MHPCTISDYTACQIYTISTGSENCMGCKQSWAGSHRSFIRLPMMITVKGKDQRVDWNDTREIRKQILELTKQYYTEKYTGQKFIPGQSPVHYAGRYLMIKNCRIWSMHRWFLADRGRYSKNSPERSRILGVENVLFDQFRIRRPIFLRLPPWLRKSSAAGGCSRGTK